MSRIIVLLLVSCLVAGTGAWLVAQDGSGLRRPLDLPTGGLGTEDDEEDSPEIISFYGAQFEGDAFFWCLDKSGSMTWGGRIDILKQQVTQAINSLSSQAEIGLVAFSTSTTPWSTLPKRATVANKAAAIGWVNSLNAVGWTCLAPAGVQTLQICNLSHKQARKVLIVGDGVPTCNGNNTEQQCLTDITAANYQSVPVDTLYISADDEGISFMQQLASMNGGTFTLVEN